jgi:hypothetical protein
MGNPQQLVAIQWACAKGNTSEEMGKALADLMVQGWRIHVIGQDARSAEPDAWYAWLVRVHEGQTPSGLIVPQLVPGAGGRHN